MAITVAGILACASTVITLQPGDVIATGTPGGVGRYREPHLLLEPGMSVEVEIAGIGTLSNGIVDEGRAAPKRIVRHPGRKSAALAALERPAAGFLVCAAWQKAPGICRRTGVSHKPGPGLEARADARSGGAVRFQARIDQQHRRRCDGDGLDGRI